MGHQSHIALSNANQGGGIATHPPMYQIAPTQEGPYEATVVC